MARVNFTLAGHKQQSAGRLLVLDYMCWYSGNCVIIGRMMETYKNNAYIPDELAGFFKEGPGKTLLVKGNPGAGKTILAFTLLRELKRKGVYLSTRVDPESIYSHIGWLKESLPAENIVDATQSERQKVAGPVTIKALKYTDVPDFLKGVYERTEKLEHALVIIDSWDAVVSHTGFYEPRERERLEHNLCDFSRKTSTDIIFIAEYIEQKPLDYLVDGVVITINNIFDMRRTRTLELQKLRGGPITQPIYLYTLDKGIFKAFSVFKGHSLEKLKIPTPIPDISQGRISTGIRDLDVIINGYGGFNLCRGNRTCYDLLQLFLMLNSLGQGKKLVLGISEQSLLANTNITIPNKLRDNIEVFSADNIKALEKRISESEKASETIFFLCLDEFGEYGKLRTIISEIIQKGGFVFGFLSEERPIDAELESMVSTSLITVMHFGVPCVYSKIPITGLHALTLDTSSGFPELTLTPIV